MVVHWLFEAERQCGVATGATAKASGGTHFRSGGGTRATSITGIPTRSRGTIGARTPAQHIHALPNAPLPRPPFAPSHPTQQLPAGVQAGRDHKPVSSGLDHDLESAYKAGHSEHSTHAEGAGLKGRRARHRGDGEGLMNAAKKMADLARSTHPTRGRETHVLIGHQNHVLKIRYTKQCHL